MVASLRQSWLPAVMAIGMLIAAGTASAQVPGNNRKSALADQPQKTFPVNAQSDPKAFSLLGGGVTSTTNAACPDIACKTGHVCSCSKITNMAVNAAGFGGNATLSLELSIDSGTFTADGTPSGFCDKSAGFGTLTGDNGNSIQFDFGGNFCVATDTSVFNNGGTFTIDGGTAQYAGTTGSGTITISSQEAFGPANGAVVTMNGALIP